MMILETHRSQVYPPTKRPRTIYPAPEPNRSFRLCVLSNHKPSGAYFFRLIPQRNHRMS